ncbi:MAG: extracellular solute-binding protein [Alphaproteobacteria bacterium]|nr:extracellular solute-binding protein [Alphaproteobacteria bacterium]
MMKIDHMDVACGSCSAARARKIIKSFVFFVAAAVSGLLVLAAAPAKADFKSDWAKLIAAAKQEGKVSIAAGGAPSRQYRHVFEAFKKKFGVNVEVSRGGAGRTTSRVLAERKAGKYTVDVALISVRINNQRLVPAKALIPFEPLLIHPEVLDKSKWHGGRYWYGDKDLKYTFFYTAAIVDNYNFWYNTAKVSKADLEAIKTPADLLAPKWKGKFGAYAMDDPSGIRQMIDGWQSPDQGPEWVRKFLTEMDVTFSPDRRVVETWLVKGRYPIMPSAGQGNEELRNLAKKGLPIKEAHLPTKVGMLRASGSGCCISAFANAPHPNAAKLFVNWFLTREGQTIIHESIPNLARSSLRNDIPFGHVIKDHRRIPGKTYRYPDADPESGARNKAIQKKIMEIWNSRQR